MALEVRYPHSEKQIGEPARLSRHPRVRVAQLVMDHMAYGWSADELCRQYGYLAPAEAHAAMLYYYDHQDEIDAEIQADLREADASQFGATTCRLAARLRSRAPR